MSTPSTKATSSRFPAWFFISLLVLLSAVTAGAQSYPISEAYVSFTMARSDYGLDGINTPGFQFSAGYNPHRFVRLTGEFSAHFHGTDVLWNDQTMKLRDYYLLLGPEFVFRNRSKFTPFVHTMVGYGARHYNVGTGVYECTYTGWWTQDCNEKQMTVVAENGLATQVGGGVDVSLGQYVSLRLLQFDYLRTHFSRGATPLVPDPSVLPPLKSWQKNYRFAFGIVFKLGTRNARRY